MKHIMLGLLFMALIGMVNGVELVDLDRLYVGCYNSTSGVLLGATGTLTCWDNDGNVDVNGEALINVETGVFYYVFNETNDRYWCKIDCVSGAIDPMIPVWQRTLPLIDSDNIGVDLDDVSGTLGTTEVSAALKNELTDMIWDEDTSEHPGAGTFGRAINDTLLDTSAQDTASKLRTLLTGSSTAVSTLITSDNIGINLNDVSGTLDAGEIGTDAIGADELAADCIGSSELSTAAADKIADNTWDELQSGHVSAGTFGKFIDAQISTVSGMSTAQNLTLYNVYSVVGATGLFDQSIAAMLGYNVSDSNVETDLDTVGGTTPEAVWDELATGHSVTGSFGQILRDIYDLLFIWS